MGQEGSKGNVMPVHLRKHGKIAFITTPKFRQSSPDLVEFFIYRHLYSLCYAFDVITTGRTLDFIREVVSRPPQRPERLLIEKGTKFHGSSQADLVRWKSTIMGALKRTPPSFPGMIHVAYELVEGRLDAVIHFTDWEDKSAKPDSAVLSREANVHNVPIATDPDTAQSYVGSWNASLARLQTGGRLFKKREQPKDPPLEGLRPEHKVLAMVAHDNMKLEMCRFAVQHAAHIFQNYDCILATGTTGGWLKRFMEASGRSPDEIKKIRCCNSGPQGGDIQIAYAVVQGICRKIVFLQDPSVSHPHDSDISLFEQAVASRDVHVELATNVASAGLLIGV